ncbi:UNVERIFIED_CONTAM: hypothetical protein FKN15_022613 [Acipenser sinensis]
MSISNFKNTRTQSLSLVALLIKAQPVGVQGGSCKPGFSPVCAANVLAFALPRG